MTRAAPVHYAPLTATNPSTTSDSRNVRIVHGATRQDSSAASGLTIPLSSLDLQQSDAQHETHHQTAAAHKSSPESSYVDHSAGQRINTDIVIAEQLRRSYPDLCLSVVPASSTDLLAYASAGLAQATPQVDADAALGKQHSWRSYVPPARRINDDPGSIAQRVFFGKFLYRWNPSAAAESVGAADNQEHKVILYVVDGRDSGYPNPIVLQYILSPPGKQSAIDSLIVASGIWAQQLRSEIWVFDQGWWQKSAELWDSVKNASWSNVILDESMKSGIRADVEGFFEARETYENLKVPWKRGIIFYGPPGNGKTISIKAMMHTLYERKASPIPTLYVRSLKSAYGGEYSIGTIFAKARQTAPCYLVFEDLDSLVTDQLRSYFLNEVDGLKSNDGILMLGSTNHLERLDPGIAKRPSRFDRKYFFDNPDTAQRVAYCHFWQGKLKGSEGVAFPDVLCGEIAGITGGFSFAYMQEAFVASLLSIARREKGLGGGGDDGDNKDPLDKYELWVEIKKQIAALREGLEKDEPEQKQEKTIKVTEISK